MILYSNVICKYTVCVVYFVLFEFTTGLRPHGSRRSQGTEPSTQSIGPGYSGGTPQDPGDKVSYLEQDSAMQSLVWLGVTGNLTPEPHSRLPPGGLIIHLSIRLAIDDSNFV